MIERSTLFLAINILLSDNQLEDALGDRWTAFEDELIALLRKSDDPNVIFVDILDEMEALFARYGVADQYNEALEAADEEEMRQMESGEQTRSIAGAEPMERYIMVPVYYGTDRVSEPGKERVKYLGKADDKLHLGVAKVSIPDDHRMGEIERPSIFKLQFKENPERDIMIHSVEELDRAAFIEQTSGLLDSHYIEQISKLPDSDEQKKVLKQVLIFIHGYNVSFDSALFRAAQVAYDLSFNGMAMLYSWPSAGSLLGYGDDEETIKNSAPHFKAFLDLVLTELGATDVHVIAHSMGNRALVNHLADFEPDALPDGAARLNQVVFAAPDVNRITFEQLARKFHQKAQGFTLYASSKDVALEASGNIVHRDGQRAGDSSPDIFYTSGVDSIDASAVKTGFMGHSYFGDSDSVIKDLMHVIPHGKKPADRPIEGVPPTGEPVYWKFPNS